MLSVSAHFTPWAQQMITVQAMGKPCVPVATHSTHLEGALSTRAVFSKLIRSAMQERQCKAVQTALHANQKLQRQLELVKQEIEKHLADNSSTALALQQYRAQSGWHALCLQLICCTDPAVPSQVFQQSHVSDVARPAISA